MSLLLSGMLISAYSVIALFFLRFWATSRDRLFLLFAAAFAILVIQRVAIAATRDLMESQAPLYLLRFIAFVVIIFAIVDKNRR